MSTEESLVKFQPRKREEEINKRHRDSKMKCTETEKYDIKNEKTKPNPKQISPVYP